jgi:hypothetical protein
MARSRKKVSIELSSGVVKRAPLNDFATVCSSLTASLKHFARCLGQQSAEFSISKLQMGSAVMAVEPESAAPELDAISELFNNTIEALEIGNPLDDRLDFAALYCLNGFSGIAKRQGVHLKIGSVNLTDNYARNLNALLEPANPALGSVSGRLERLTVHFESQFTLYPPIPGEQIECNFQRDTLTRVLDAVGHNVIAYGTLYYAPSKILPVRVDVDEFEIVEPDENLPTLLDARGLLPPLSTSDQQLLGPNYADEWQ